MLEKILNIYYYPGKSPFTKVADAILWPTNRALNYPRISLEKGLQSTCKCSNIFLRILMGIVAIVLLPITFVAIWIKGYDGVNENLHNQVKSITSSSAKSEDCAICADEEKEAPLVKLTCDHEFHIDCIKRWADEKGEESDCPMCRFKIDPAILKIFSLAGRITKTMDERALDLLHRFPPELQGAVLSALEELVQNPQRGLQFDFSQYRG